MQSGARSIGQAPAYFENVQKRTLESWALLESKPDLAGPWHQLFNQVQSPRHVVSELLQNADDAGATKAFVDIHDGEFVFAHNGEDFTEEHFNSLCNFGYSNKRSLHTIGFRGIGFKSTFSLGDQVRLLTPSLSVAFNRARFTSPVWIDSHNKTSATSIRVTIKDEYRQQELKKNLDEWLHSPASLLFFHNLRSLRVCGQDVQWLSCGAGPVSDSEWMALSSSPEQKYLLIRSTKEDFPDEALEEIRQERMVPSSDEATFPPCRVEIVLGMEGRLFVILPTGVMTGLPFACNAPFIQDPARLKIKDPDISPTNRWLLARAGKLAATALLAWVGDEKLEIGHRVQAYELLPDVDRDGSSLEGSCAALVEAAVAGVIRASKFVVTEAGDLTSRGECQAIPPQLLDIWSHDQVISFFIKPKKSILSRLISEGHLKKLMRWKAVEIIETSHVIDVLSQQRLPRPDSWRKLLILWVYIAKQVYSYGYSWQRMNINVVPVQGQNVLYSADEVVRLGEKKLLSTEEDWKFLAEWLLVLNQNWTRFLAEQKRNAEERVDKSLGQEVEDAYGFLEKVGLAQASDANLVIQRVADTFFAQEDCDIEDCIRLAQLAASLGANVSENFQFVTHDGYRRSAHECIVADVCKDVDLFVDENWHNEHVLHSDYDVMLSCSESEWRQWIISGRSSLSTFVPLEHSRTSIWGRGSLQKTLKERNAQNPPFYGYVTNDFIIEDWDFDDDFWRLWHDLAKEDDSFWSTLLARIIKQPTQFWSKTTTAKALQRATTGTIRSVSSEPLLPAWIVKFRNLPCLQDTRGKYRNPAELLRRTPETEPLLDIEPFIRAELDIESSRPLLDLLGVRTTPTGPEQLLDRLRALATVDNPPVYEVEKWYHRIDRLIDTCSTAEVEKVKRAFNTEKIILTEAGAWCAITEVFLSADEDSVPDVALIHPAVRHLALWVKVGVANRPTVELGIKWLSGLQSGCILSADELRRVRSILQRYPERIWNECGHWLNIEGEWVATENLEYSLTMQTLVAWQHLFKPIKQKTANFQMLQAATCELHPFSLLATLAQSIEERSSSNYSLLSEPKKLPWLYTLGSALCRIIFADPEEQQRIQRLGARLTETTWQAVSGLQTVPYIKNTPAGTPRQIKALWQASTLYVENGSTAKMAKEVVQELSRAFNKQEIFDAIKLCYERSPEFVSDYIEENFKLMPKEVIEPLPDTPIFTNKKYEQKEDTRPDQLQNSMPSSVPIDNSTKASTSHLDESLGMPRVDPTLDEDHDTGTDAETPLTQRRRSQIVLKPKLIELFAAENRYMKGTDGGIFYREDGGRLEYISSFSFPWQEFTSTGEVLQCYWIKEICLTNEPLQIEADVWELCVNHPEQYSLILAGVDGSPIVYSGEEVCRLRDSGCLKVFPASYRLVYAHEEP